MRLLGKLQEKGKRLKETIPERRETKPKDLQQATLFTCSCGKKRRERVGAHFRGALDWGAQDDPRSQAVWASMRS